jgi:AAA+ superfamily predicted ATPase
VALDDRTDAPAIVREVLGYFLNHPGASGSVRDLADSRIPQEIAVRNVTQITDAVFWLLKHELLVSKNELILTLNTARLAQAEALMLRFAPRLLPEPAPRAVPATVLPMPPAPGSLMATCLGWIDATLRDYHERNPLGPDDHPGLSRSAAAVARAVSPVIAAEPERRRGRDENDAALIDAFDAAGDDEPLAVLCRRLALTPFELQAFLLCLAPEIDAKYQTVFGVLNDDLHGRRSVTLGLLCRLLGDPLAVRMELERSGGLTRWRLLERGAVLPHGDEALHLDPAIVGWVLQKPAALETDARLSAFLRDQPWAGASWLHLPEEIRLVERLRHLLSDPGEEGWIALAGGEKNGARASIEAAAQADDLTLLRISIPAGAAADAVTVTEVAARAARAARLLDAVPVLDASPAVVEGLGVSGIARMIEEVSGGPRPAVVVTSEVNRIVKALTRSPGHCIHIELPPDVALAGTYLAAAQQAGLQIDADDAQRLALAYPLPLDAIQDALWLALLNGAALHPADEHARAFAAACRRVASPDLPKFGRRVDPVFRLRDVVLPEAEHRQLAEIVAHVRHAPQVMHEWGFGEQLPYGRGVTALFCGESGTGKTMAAQAIARELGTDAYVVDLSRVVSKYIGESEKNLDSVLTDAERGGAVVVFDEADALFGKRSEIKDAHDRYANLEVSFLLQRMEAFRGLAILTTNYRRNMDSAFVRRIRFIVEFRRPDASSREAIWRRCLTADAPLAADVHLPFLAKRLDITGGTIQLVAVRAAFAAAAAGASAIGMRHVIEAARAELLKLGLTSTERELATFGAAFERRAAEVA